MRLVIDTDVMVAAMRSRSGASAELLRRIRAGRHLLLASHTVFLEYRAVLTRPEHLLASGVSRADVEDLLKAFDQVLQPVVIDYRWRGLLPDPDDDLMLEAAVNGRADAIVTFNRRHFGAAAKFGIEVIAPSEALNRD